MSNHVLSGHLCSAMSLAVAMHTAVLLYFARFLLNTRVHPSCRACACNTLAPVRSWLPWAGEAAQKHVA